MIYTSVTEHSSLFMVSTSVIKCHLQKILTVLFHPKNVYSLFDIVTIEMPNISAVCSIVIYTIENKYLMAFVNFVTVLHAIFMKTTSRFLQKCFQA